MADQDKQETTLDNLHGPDMDQSLSGDHLKDLFQQPAHREEIDPDALDLDMDLDAPADRPDAGDSARSA